MKRLLLLLLAIVSLSLTAQETVIYDFEGENPGAFQHFGSSLDGTVAPVIDNPNATGINETAKVMELVRPAASQTFAGAFAQGGLPFSVGVTAGSMICVDVHADHLTTFTVKLENSPTGSNWERTVANTLVNEWEQLCYTLDSMSADGAGPAVGHSYPGMAIFKDLNEPASEGDSTIYIDNMIYVGELNEVLPSNVTFRVDASEITVGENGMFLAGNAINNWMPEMTPMSDEDGDGVWEVTVELDPGEVQYKFVNSGDFEELNEGSCTITSGGFINRLVTVGENDMVLPVVFFGSCDGPQELECTVLFDWETEETSTNYQYFGSTLDGMTAEIIDNPDPSGANSSATVLSYTKAANSETWAGAFANPAPTTPIDLTNGGQLCADVWFANPGNIGLKIEGSSTNANWVDTVSVTETNTWVTVCVEANSVSLEDPFQVAAGHVYTQYVIFPDFGTAFTEDQTYFIDNISFKTTQAETAKAPVTFEVNMNEYAGEFTTVHVSGAFNDWSGTANPLADEDGDGVWSTTLELETGSYEYKFTVDDWADQEFFDGSDVCTKTTVTEGGDVFVNREVLVNDTTSVGPFCWESCYDCGASVNITWNVNMENETVSEDGVYLAGGPFFGHAELPSMTDEDGDGVYTITLNREIGFTTDYTFLNGICLPDWNCKEQIAGQDCAVEPFNDRNLGAVMMDTVINTCFGACTTDGTCPPPVATYMATFSVDMTNETVGAEGVFLTGEFVGWSSDAIPMSDEDGDNIYTATTELEEGVVQYKFVNSGEYEEFAEEGECNITTADGAFINRVLLMEAKDTIVTTYFFNSCGISSSLYELDFVEDLFSATPTVVNDYVTLAWKNNESRNITVVNAAGVLIDNIKTEASETERMLNVSDYASGIYFIKMDTQTSFGIQKIIVE